MVITRVINEDRRDSDLMEGRVLWALNIAIAAFDATHRRYYVGILACADRTAHQSVHVVMNIP